MEPFFSWTPASFFPYSVNFVRTHRKTAMTIEKRKLELKKGAIEIEKLDDRFVQAEMEARTQESLEAIRNGEVLTLDEFFKSNEEWLKKPVTK
jgi:hypothetical protein